MNNDIVYNVSSKLEVRKSSTHGVGVFCKDKIQKGETVEICRMLKLDWKMKYHHDRVIRDYCWIRNCNCNDCNIHGQNMYLAMGFGSLYNHSDSPNMDTKTDYNNFVMYITANKDIQEGEEIFISYGDNYWKTRNKN